MIMKWLIRISFPALGLLLLLIFFGINDPEQISAPGTDTEKSDKIPAFEGLVPSPITTTGPDIIFKWRDTNGNWHYADQPPEHGPWNALAIERTDKGLFQNQPTNPDTDWQSPYRAPFSLAPDTGSSGS
ncbi:MAG TPA: DUF4124 domain-containing protein [Marinobacter sp.]|nr:DUF4124 domain-containing protein [Marinobacter sp.]